MSSIAEPLLKMIKSNQGRAVAVSAVIAGLVIGYSLLSSTKPSSKKELEVYLMPRSYNFHQILKFLFLQRAFSSSPMMTAFLWILSDHCLYYCNDYCSQKFLLHPRYLKNKSSESWLMWWTESRVLPVRALWQSLWILHVIPSILTSRLKFPRAALKSNCTIGTTMHIAKKTKEDLLAEGKPVDIETLRQIYILPSFEQGLFENMNWKVIAFNTFSLFLIFFCCVIPS